MPKYRGTERFFILMPDQCREAVVALAHYTGWGLSELMDLDGEELIDWVDAANRVAKKSRG